MTTPDQKNLIKSPKLLIVAVVLGVILNPLNTTIIQSPYLL